MSILGAWTGEGSLDAATAVAVAAAEREGWAALRSLQGDPLADVVRYASSGGDAARGVPRTRVQVDGLAALPVLLGDLSVDEMAAYGVDLLAGFRRFEFYTDVEVKLTDLLRYPSGAAETWAVVATAWDANIGRCLVTARPAPAGGA